MSLGNNYAQVTITPVDLNGLDLELGYNRKLAAHLGEVFDRYIQEHGLGTNVSKPNPVPPQRFRLHAIQAYLQRPFLADALPAKEVERHWEMSSHCNAMMDKVVGLTTVNVVDEVVATVMRFIPDMNTLGNALAAKMASLKA